MTETTYPVRTDEEKPPSLVRNSTFRWFWSGQLVSLLGSQIFPIAVVALTVPASDRPLLSLSLVMAARFLALAIFIVIGGVLADRFDRFRLMIGTDVVQILAVVPIAVVGTESPLWLITTVTFVLGAGEALFQPMYDASIVSIVDPRLVARANAASKVLRNTARVLGPATAALLVTVVGVHGALVLDIASFTVSTATLLVLITRGHHTRTTQMERNGSAMWREAFDGLRLVLRMRWLAALEAMALVHVLLAVAPWLVLLPIVAYGRLGGIDTYGLLLGAFALGGISGALVAARLRLRRPGTAVLLGLMPFGVCCAGLALSDSRPLLIVLFIAAGFGTELADVFKMTAIQQQVPPEYLGRVFALDFFASFVMMPLGQLLTGVLVAPGHEDTFLLFAAGVILTTTLLPLAVSGVSTLGADPAGRRKAPALEAAS